MIAVHAFLREHRDEILRSWEALVADDPSSVGPALRERLPSLLDLLVRSLETVAPPREAPDSDEIRALRESEARLKAMADGTPLAIWSTDAKGGVEFVNRAYCEFFGVTQEEVATRGWQPLIHPEDAPGYVAAFMESLALRKPFHAFARVRRADGAWRWIESFGQPRLSEDGTFLGVAGSSPDVTERKHAEDELRLADQRKSEFLAVLSHELRNPLAPIRNSIFLLERAAPGSAQSVRAREVLDRQAGHLTRLVDDLLDVTRVSRGKIDLRRTRIDLRDVVRKTTDDMRSIFEASAVALEVERPVGPIWVDGDATRLAQVLGNLLQNAVKFTPPAGKVVVHVAAVEGKGTLSVRDTGAGMQPDDVDRMFQPFEQGGQGMARTRGGLGLGLALVKGLVELHGGAVRATSAGPGRGSEFVVTLPLAEVAVPARRAERADGAPGKNVLIVEDNADAAQTLADVLELAGHRVRVARDGRSGLALALALVPDVILCDIGLPDIDGYELARAARREPTLAGTRLVALTGYAQPEDRDRARGAGFDAHLPKPPPLDELDALLRGTPAPAD